ncbi:MAG: T9SS type A sorting domain-containing protein [Bacteroidales bacterium]|nr:T9SS type A sorting domain-containing protein [Bacteroidales bacterium]
MLQHFYDTIYQHQHVIICEPSQSYDFDYDMLATAPIHFGSNAIIGNYFKMPDSDSSQCATNNYSTYFPVIEVYFDQPVVVSHDFVIGTNLPPEKIHQRHNNRNMSHQINCGVLSILLNQDDSSIPLWTTLYKEDSIHLNILAQWSSNTWGGPFPILTPAPCMPPIWLNVVEQHRKGATIEWRAQYANSYFELEYGPQGFAEGSGTVITPIYPNAQYNCQITLDSLVMDADYTVRIRSYCYYTSGYSDWTSLDFHTESHFNVTTSTNNDDWGVVNGGGTFLSGSEVCLTAYPKSAEHPFLNWSDGSNQNPRLFTVTQDTSFLAIFANNNDTEDLANATQPFVSLTPNPAKESSVLACSEIINEWTLFDIQGRKTAFGKPSSYTATIDLHSLHPAVYILSVRTPKGSQTKKLVVR